MIATVRCMVVLHYCSMALAVVQYKLSPMTHKVMLKCTSDASDCVPQDETQQVKGEVNLSATFYCDLPNTEHLMVVWVQEGHEVPLAFGTTLIFPHPRITLESPTPGNWSLTISHLNMSDSGIYSCHLNGDADNQKRFNLTVVKPSYQVDQPMVNQYITTEVPFVAIKLEAENVAFWNQPWQIQCVVYFRSLDAKSSSTVQIEWYHNGVRQWTRVNQGIRIYSKWVESNVLMSEVNIQRVRPWHGGQWLCLKMPDDKSHDTMESARMDLAVIGIPESQSTTTESLSYVDSKKNARSTTPGFRTESKLSFLKQRNVYKDDMCNMSPHNDILGIGYSLSIAFSVVFPMCLWSPFIFAHHLM